MKTYGKEPEALESITQVILRDMEGFPADQVMRAIKTHCSRSQEFFTSADLIGIIKRNGKPPLKESDIVSIRKKDGEDRTSAEWKMLKEWEDQQQDGWNEFPDPAKDAATLAENLRLRSRIAELEQDNAKAWKEVKRLRHFENIQVIVANESDLEKVNRTVEHMKAAGCPQADIDAFKQQQGIAA